MLLDTPCSLCRHAPLVITPSSPLQELVFIGKGLHEDAIRAALDACLVTPEEMCEYRERWAASETSMAAWMAHEYLRRNS